jgi:dolichyl-phosphate beta-glucosyltransferase
MTRRTLDLSVVIPAYNEERRIGPTVRAVLDFLTREGRSGEVVLVDDGSADATCTLVRGLADADDRVRLIRLPRNRGKGYAVRTGVLSALGERILFADADGAAPIEEVARLERALDAGAAIAIGSRALPSPGVRVEALLGRRVAGRIFHQLVKWLAVRGVADTQCGFKLFTADAARDLFSRMLMDGFSFDVELLVIARRRGLRVAEVPVDWTHQPGSRIDVAADGLRMARDLFRIRALALRGIYDRPQSAAGAIATPRSVRRAAGV